VAKQEAGGAEVKSQTVPSVGGMKFE